jgi:hypothetical protein
MPRRFNQNDEFAYNVMPTLFHRSTLQFMQLLELDGLKFLNFWWDQWVRKNLPRN